MDEPGAGPAPDAREALERLLLGGPRRYTRLQVAELAGMPPARTQRLWRALGFPDAADDDPAFTDADVEALDVLSTLIDSGFVGPDTEASIARAMGQSLSRLADWQTDMLADALTRGAGEDDEPASASADEAIEAARPLLPRLRHVQDYVWRRHLAANADRLLAATGPGDRRELAVGFADLVGYTSRSRGMGGRELGRDGRGLREHRDRGHRPAPRPGGEDRRATACCSPPPAPSTPSRSGWSCPRRGTPRNGRRCGSGAAYGAVLTRLGDVYSPVVNLASRLTSLARPGTMLVDRELAQRLRGAPAYRVRPLRRVSVRGYDHLQPWLVRRRPAGEDDNAFESMLDELADESSTSPRTTTRS